MALRQQLTASSTRLRADFEKRTAAFGQNLDKGEAREAAFREILSHWLPTRHSVGRGEIVDATGNRSKQMDAVIYDEMNAPLIFSETDSPALFPVEGVYGFAEVKSNLSPKDLRDGWSKSLSVYSLQRQKFQYSLAGAMNISGTYKAFSSVFAFAAPMEMEDLIALWKELAITHPPSERLNIICILNRGCLMYLSNEGVWSLGNHPGDTPIFVETGEDSLLMFMLSAWIAMGPAPPLTIPDPIAYVGGSLQYEIKK